jgi:hypothetical protein
VLNFLKILLLSNLCTETCRTVQCDRARESSWAFGKILLSTPSRRKFHWPLVQLCCAPESFTRPLGLSYLGPLWIERPFLEFCKLDRGADHTSQLFRVDHGGFDYVRRWATRLKIASNRLCRVGKASQPTLSRDAALATAMAGRIGARPIRIRRSGRSACKCRTTPTSPEISVPGPKRRRSHRKRREREADRVPGLRCAAASCCTAIIRGGNILPA